VSVDPYNTSIGVGDVEPIFEHWARESATTRAERPCVRNIRYGDSSAETLDFFPAGAGSPIVIYFHGGYWRRLDKDDVSYVAQGLLPLGISVVVVNYGLVPNFSLRQIVDQAKRAVKWVRNNNDRLEFNPARMSVFGHSAGGHLAAMAAVEVPVHALISISGLHDLDPLRYSHVQQWLDLDRNEAQALSPIHYAPARRFPIFTTAGSKESFAFKDQGQKLVDAWSPYGCKAEYAEMPGDDHFSICWRMTNPSDPLTQKIAELAR
jgi:arylformamidase